jgi:hypothetical protein
VRKFFERELIALLGQCDGWRGRLSVESVTLATNSIRVEVRHDGHRESPLLVSFSQYSGWLLASLEGAGWLASLSTPTEAEFANALAGFYKLAAVDLVEEQVRANLPPTYSVFEMDSARLVLHATRPGEPWLCYDLTRWNGRLRPEAVDGSRVVGPELDADRVVFRRVPLTWMEWEEAWRSLAESGDLPRLTRAGAALGLTTKHAAPSIHLSERIITNGEQSTPAVADRNGAG